MTIVSPISYREIKQAEKIIEQRKPKTVGKKILGDAVIFLLLILAAAAVTQGFGKKEEVQAQVTNSSSTPTLEQIRQETERNAKARELEQMNDKLKLDMAQKQAEMEANKKAIEQLK